jgi:hypothetical protein
MPESRGLQNGKDAREIEKKMKEYREYIDWTDSGILMPEVANLAARTIGIEPDRVTKRHRGFLIGWLNMHYGEIKGLIPQLVFPTPTESTDVPIVEEPKADEHK